MTTHRVAVLGGGIAGLTTAFELTRTPELRAKYEVTLYQMGWRLGGKLASGRAGREGRNLEHGLHGWFGFYENAFRILQDTYAEWTPDPRCTHQRWQDVVFPHEYTPFGDFSREDWHFHPSLFPRDGFIPGDGHQTVSLTALVTKTIASVVNRLIRPPAGSLGAEGSLLRSLLTGIGAARGTHAPIPDEVSSVAARARAIETSLMTLAWRIAGGRLVLGPLQQRALRAVLMRAADFLRQRVDTASMSRSRRFEWYVVEFGLTALIGLLDPAHGDLLRDGDLDRLNHLELREFFRNYGASEALLECPLMRVCYSGAFQYAEGNRDRPDVEAGTGLRIIFRLGLLYKGAVMYGLRGPTGDTVIAPIYEVLRARGVKFEFFHKVTELGLSDDKSAVQTVRFDEQAEVIGEYEPCVTLDYAPCWPAQPRWEQLVGGASMRERGVDFESHWCAEPPVRTKTIRRGEQFDDVVLAVPLGAFKPLGNEPSMCAELMAANPRFAAMAEAIGLIPSISVQLWADKDLAELGFDHQRSNVSHNPPAMVELPAPLEIWADMSSVLRYEQWRGNKPRSLHYLCGVWHSDLYRAPRTDATAPARAKQRAHDEVQDWLERYGALLWPDAVQPDGSFDWSVLHDEQDRAGAERLRAQYVRPNVDPVECCSATTKGTSRLRLRADESGFDNLFLAGAWTRTPLNIESVEGATSSGRAAARAVMGADYEVYGESLLAEPLPPLRRAPRMPRAKTA